MLPPCVKEKSPKSKSHSRTYSSLPLRLLTPRETSKPTRGIVGGGCSVWLSVPSAVREEGDS